MIPVDTLREEAEEQPEIWEVRLCCQGQGQVQLGSKHYSACPYFHLLTCFTFPCHILKQELYPSL